MLRPQQAQSSQDYLTLTGACSPELRITDSGSAEAVSAALSSCAAPPRKAKTMFRHMARIVDSDALPANLKGERLLRSQVPIWGEAWHLHLECRAHKVHQGAERVFKMAEGASLVTGIANMALCLSSTTNWPKVRAALRELLSEKLEVIQGAAHLSPRAVEYRNKSIAAFKPERLSGQGILCICAAVMFNGDWKSALPTHHCQSCCQDRQHTLRKAMWLCNKLLFASRPCAVAKGNWGGWPRSFPVMIFACMRNMLPVLFEKVQGVTLARDAGVFNNHGLLPPGLGPPVPAPRVDDRGGGGHHDEADVFTMPSSICLMRVGLPVIILQGTSTTTTMMIMMMMRSGLLGERRMQ